MGWLWAGFLRWDGWLSWRVGCEASGFRGEGLGGVPWELALLVVGLNLLGLCEGGETIMTLVPEGSIVVRAEFFVEVDDP